MNASIDHYRTEFDSVKSLLAGSSQPWVQGMREQAMQQFHRGGFPTRRNEEWKYTDLADMGAQLFKPAAADQVGRQERPAPSRTADDNTIRMTFENGCWLVTEAGLDLPPPGVTITSLGKMLTDFPDRIKQHLALFSNPADHALVPLNTAFSNDGAFVFLEKNVVLDRPLELLFHSRRQTSPLLSVPRNLIVLEKGAEAIIVEKYTGEAEAEYWTNTQTEIVLEAGARLEHIQLQSEGRSAFHTSYTHVQQHRDSQYTSHVISLGGKLSRNDLDISLEAAEAGCELNGLYLADGNQHMDHHTRIDHIEADCNSRELYKGILADQSRGVFNGKVYVHSDAQRTAAYQANPNLLLSREAEIDTKPQLEIYADDVKCSHGATIGQLDEDALFFLRSRGIDEAQARLLLLKAFAEEIVEKTSDPRIRQSIMKTVSEKIHRITAMQEDN